MAEHYIIDDKEHVYEAAYEKHHMKKTITQNGKYNAEDESGDITGYSEVDVNVSGGGPAPVLISKSITENGTYNASSDEADGYSQVSVNVPAPPSRINDAKSLIPENLINLSTKAYEKEETS